MFCRTTILFPKITVLNHETNFHCQFIYYDLQCDICVNKSEMCCLRAIIQLMRKTIIARVVLNALYINIHCSSFSLDAPRKTWHDMSRHHGPKFTLGVIDQWVVIYDKSHIMQKKI